MLEDVLPCKTTVTQRKLYRCEGRQYVSIQEHMESWYMHISKKLLTTTGTQALFAVTSVKLHLTAYNIKTDCQPTSNPAPSCPLQLPFLELPQGKETLRTIFKAMKNSNTGKLQPCILNPNGESKRNKVS